MRRFLLVLCTAVAACAATHPAPPDAGPGEQPDDPPAGRWIPLVDATLWQATPEDRDPLAGHRGNIRVCPPFAWYEELGGIEIETTGCAYVSLDQPLARAVGAGDRLRVTAWWQTLVTLEPVEGHLAVVIDGQVVWQERVAIPGPADAREVEFLAPTRFPAGTTVTFHLHNHGYNTWNLNDFSAFIED